MATLHLVDGTGFGEWLKQAREARGLTLDDLTRETKISLRNLEALEHGKLGLMPVFYQRAEVRAVARAMGLDEGVAVDRLDAAIAPSVLQSEPKAAHSKPRPALAEGFVALSLGALVLAVVWTGSAMVGGTPATPLPAAAGQPERVAAVPQPPSLTESPAQAPADVALTDTPAEEVETSPGALAVLVVRTQPPGARVTVNGIGWGVSPVTIRVPAGEKYIRATKEGFAGMERALALTDGARQELNVRLRPVD